MPWSTRYRLALAARRWPRARLYSSEPRSSALPSIRILMPGLACSQGSFASSVAAASGLIVDLSKSKWIGAVILAVSIAIGGATQAGSVAVMFELYWHIAGGGGGGGGGGGATQFGLEAGMLSRPAYVHITSGRAPPNRKLSPPRR